MGNKTAYQVVFKAGYEVQANSQKQAEEQGRLELAKELIQDGAKRFIVEITKLKE